MLYAERLGMNKKAKATSQKHPRERDKERRQFKPLDQTPHRDTKDRPREQSHRDGNAYGHLAGTEQGRDQDARKCDNRPDREIDSARKNDECRANGCNADESVVPEQVDCDTERKEIAVEETAGQIEAK